MICHSLSNSIITTRVRNTTGGYFSLFVSSHPGWRGVPHFHPIILLLVPCPPSDWSQSQVPSRGEVPSPMPGQDRVPPQAGQDGVPHSPPAPARSGWGTSLPPPQDMLRLENITWHISARFQQILQISPNQNGELSR